MSHYMLESAIKGRQWEIAKGHLRALAMLQGSYSSGGDDTHECQRWRALDKKVEQFIKEIEDDGLHE